MSYVVVDEGVRLYVQDVGSGPVIVLLAGVGMNHQVWDREVRLLSDRHRVVCIDLRGHGLSDRPRAGYSIERLAADVHAVLMELGIRRASVIGWSFGGQVAFRFAATWPGMVERLVLVGTNAVRASRSDRFPFGRSAAELETALIRAEDNDRIGGRRNVIAYGFASAPNPYVLDWLVGVSLLMPSWSAIACYASMIHTDLVPYMPAVSMPVLIIRGIEDKAQSAAGAQWLLAHLHDARFVEIANCGHYPMVEAPNEFFDTLSAFVVAKAVSPAE